MHAMSLQSARTALRRQFFFSMSVLICSAGSTVMGQCPQWHALSSGGQTGVNQTVTALVEHNGDLIAGGMFTTAGGQTVNHLARWDGSAWHPFASGGGFVGVNGVVRALTVWNGDLIVGGTFSAAGGIAANNIARWDGSGWHPFIAPGFALGVNGTVYALATYQGDLVVGGFFSTAGTTTVNNIARWNGSTWQPFASGGSIGISGGGVLALADWNGSLVVTGQFSSAGGQVVEHVAVWTGVNWQPLSMPGLDFPNDLVVAGQSVVARCDGVTVSGTFDSAGGVAVAHVARWDGTAWHPYVSGGQTGLAMDTRVLQVLGDHLYAGGTMVTAGGQTVNRIARWDGAAWHPLTSGGQIGVGGSGVVSALGVYGGSLVAGGTFLTAGGLTVNRIARWGNDVEDVFVAPPQHTVAVAGTLATLSADVLSSTTVTSYAWHKDGAALSDDGRITGSDSAVLSIDPVEEDDLGVFHLTVTYPCETFTSNPVALSVLPGSKSRCPANLNDDLVVDFSDLLILLSSWGPCP